MEEQKLYEAKLKSKITEWEAELEKLKAKAEYHKLETTSELKDKIDEAKNKQSSLEQQLEKMKTSGEGAWSEMKQGLEKASGEIETAIKNAKERMN